MFQDLGSRLRLPCSTHALTDFPNLSECRYSGEIVVEVQVEPPCPRKLPRQAERRGTNLAGSGARRLVEHETVRIARLDLVDGVKSVPLASRFVLVLGCLRCPFRFHETVCSSRERFWSISFSFRAETRFPRNRSIHNPTLRSRPWDCALFSSSTIPTQ